MFEEELQNLHGQERKCFLDSLKCISENEWQLFFDCIDRANGKKSEKNIKIWSEPQCFSESNLKDSDFSIEALSQIGCNSFGKGEVAMLTVAGGLGTRLGFDGPKGLFPVTPIKHKPLFQVFSEKLKALQNKYGKPLHWLIMTSEDTDEKTREAFAKNNWYSSEYVHFFKQGTLPAFTYNRTCVLEKDGSVRYYPDGHGGVFKALHKSGLLPKLQTWGIKYVSYFQVDNPLVRLDDSLFLGTHIQQQSEFSTKVVEKTNPQERVGVFIQEDRNLKLVEYSELPENLSKERTASGVLKYRWGNTAIHLLNLDFIERCVDRALPLHVAHKKTQHWQQGKLIEEPCFKLEQFIFDALAYAKKSILFEVKREQEFSPVKNATGNDSLITCEKDQISRWIFWLNKVLSIDKNFETEKNKNELIEISPLFADNFSDFKKAWNTLEQKPKTLHGLYLE